MNLSPIELEKLSKYTSGKHILVAESNPTTRHSLVIFLKRLGVKDDMIISASSFAAAAKEIEKKKPQIIICDYELGPQCGLDLIQAHKQQYLAKKESLFVLLTGNSSQRAVARAAEEEVDCYILKPFSARLLSESMTRAVTAKIEPHPYLDAIDTGKVFLSEEKLDDALRCFEEARGLHKNPALACYYLGQVKMRSKEFDQAEMLFREGLGHNKIHYKCLTGLFEALVQQSKYMDGYEIIKKISYYYPANSQRLASVLKFAILTESYSDVERYYRLFTQVKDKNPDLIKYISAALVVCGRYYLQRNTRTRAIELFNYAVAASQKNTKILREIILALIEFKLENSAEAYFGQLSSEYRLSQDYKVLAYLFEDRKSTRGDAISRGEFLLKSGVEDPLIYQILIARHLEDGNLERVTELVQLACHKWPEHKKKFHDMEKVKKP